MSRLLSPRGSFLLYLILGGLFLTGGAEFRPLGWVGVLNAAQRHEVTPLFQLHKMSFRINSNYVFLVKIFLDKNFTKYTRHFQKGGLFSCNIQYRHPARNEMLLWKFGHV